MYRPELKNRQGYNTVKVMAAPDEPINHSGRQRNNNDVKAAGGLIQRKSP